MAFVVAFDETFSSLDNWLINSTKNGSSNGYPGGPAQFGTDEIETVTDDPSNIALKNGNLHITPTVKDGRWYSARIETTRVFKPAAGSIMRVEARLQLPNVHGAEALGYWPAFWMMGSSQRDMRWTWPACGEFDITESVNGVNRNWSTLHGGPASSWGGPFGEPSGFSNGGVAPASGDIWGEFHEYAFEWDRSAPKEILRWYLDGRQVHSAIPANISAGDWKNMSSHPGYFIILNVAMGGQFPAALGGGPTPTTRAGAPLVVDYVKVSYDGSEAPEVAQGNDGLGTGSPTPTDPPVDPETPPVDPVDPVDPVEEEPVSTEAPSNLRVIGHTHNSVTVRWDGPEGDYDVLRAGVRISTTRANEFTDVGLGESVPYIYSIKNTAGKTADLKVALPLPVEQPEDPPVDPEPEPETPAVEDRHYSIDLIIPADGSTPRVSISEV